MKIRFARSAHISFQQALKFIHQDNPQAAFNSMIESKEHFVGSKSTLTPVD